MDETESFFFRDYDGTIVERLDDAPNRAICIVTGADNQTIHENAEFLLTVLNGYANREITAEELEAVHVD